MHAELFDGTLRVGILCLDGVECSLHQKSGNVNIGLVSRNLLTSDPPTDTEPLRHNNKHFCSILLSEDLDTIKGNLFQWYDPA